MWTVIENDLPGETRFLLINRLSFSLLFLFVGFPLWFSTTSTYRASLPYNRISTLASTPLTLPIRIDSSLPPSFIDEFKTNLSQLSDIRFVDSDNENSLDLTPTTFSSPKMTSFQTASSYEISFYLVNNNDHGYSLNVEKFQRIISSTIVPYLVDHYSSLFDLDISTETISNTRGILPSETLHILQPQQLPFLINKLEHSLHRSTKHYRQKIYFILFMPDGYQSPLTIAGQDQKSILQSFLVPKWGGVIFFNKFHLTNDDEETEQLHQIMNQFLVQFNQLLGIPLSFKEWIYLRIIENYNIGRRTLLTLSELLLSIPNIVIDDAMAEKVQHAVESLEQCRRGSNGSLQQQHTDCQQGRQLADQVFFGPSLLKLLYFASDQKFAIYIPLYLPMGLPLAWTLLHDIKTLINLFRKYRLSRR